MAVVKHKVPSQAASGADTFNDNLVGVQITDGSSQLTNTNFALDNAIPQKDDKSFRSSPFSNFLTLNDLKQETSAPTTQTSQQIDNDIKFNGSKDDTGKSLFGSLSSRILVSIGKIVTKFPAAVLVDSQSIKGTNPFTATNIVYDINTKTTQFNIETGKLYNTFDVVFSQPNSNIIPTTDNEIRNFYSSYTKYVIDLSGSTFNILNYTQTNISNVISLQVDGNPFNGVSTYAGSFLLRPNDGIVEEFFIGLDDLEGSLLNRETNPIYLSSFRVPRDNFNGTKTQLVTVQYNWPIAKDGWNIQTVGIDYDVYVNNLSSVASEIDEYKSNIFVRFLASPQLFEFDSEDQKIQSIFQLYGQSFDKVKKYIDNIAFMRNVSYDGINNLPDVLLKNLANTLGLETVNLFDEKTLNETLYSRTNTQYDGTSVGKNLIEAEHEFYRRLLVNLSYIYKSKGTRASIDFFLRFLGAPEPMIKIEEYVYKVTSTPKSFNLENDIYEVLLGVRTQTTATLDPNTFIYTTSSITGSTTLDRASYPVDEMSGLPRNVNDSTGNLFFQKGSGWYDITLNHRSPLMIDTDLSVLTGRTKSIVTKNAPFTYGEDYFDMFRTLPGLDTGYEFVSEVMNGKNEIINNNSSLILNRKNINVYLSSSQAIEYDIYRKSRDLLLTFGSNSLLPQTGVTFAEYLNNVLNEQIKNSNTIKYKKNYIALEDIYNGYITQTGFKPYNFIDVNEFINKMGPYWTKVIDQIIPSTTLWTGGNIIENNIFGRSKYKYQFGCQPKEFIEDLYPDFLTSIKEDLETILGEENNFRGLIDIGTTTFFPTIEIDGVSYSSEDCAVTLSGITNTLNSAKLFDPFPMSGCTTLTSNDPNNFALICNYEQYLNPDIIKIKELWKTALSSLIDTIVNKSVTGYTAGYENYSYFLSTTGSTYTTEFKPLLRYSFFIDSDQKEKIKFTSIKNGPTDCSVNDYFKFTFDSEYKPIDPQCKLGFSYGVINTGTTGGGYYGDLVINITGATGNQTGGNLLTVYTDCGNSSNILNFTSGCEYIVAGFTNTQVMNVMLLDSDNCELKFKINGLTYSGSTIVPVIIEEDVLFYGLKADTEVLVISGATINSTTTGTNITNYIGNGTIIKKLVKDVVSGDKILSADFLPCSGFTNDKFKTASVTNDYSFVLDYVPLLVSDTKCLGSVKKMVITGKTKNDVTEIFEVLPTTKLSVYTKYEVSSKVHYQQIDVSSYVGDLHNITEHQSRIFLCDDDAGLTATPTKSYFFDERFPIDLQKRKTTPIEPCCDYPKNYYDINGDFLITQDGELIEVIDFEINNCDPSVYFSFVISGNVENYNRLFNGNNDYQLLLQHNLTTIPSPTPVPTITWTPTPTPTNTNTPTPTNTPTNTPTPTPTPTITPTPSVETYRINTESDINIATEGDDDLNYEH